MTEGARLLDALVDTSRKYVHVEIAVMRDLIREVRARECEELISHVSGPYAKDLQLMLQLRADLIRTERDVDLGEGFST